MNILNLSRREQLEFLLHLLYYIWNKVKADFKKEEWKENRRWDVVKDRLGENLFWEETKGIQKTYTGNLREQLYERLNLKA